MFVILVFLLTTPLITLLGDEFLDGKRFATELLMDEAHVKSELKKSLSQFKPANQSSLDSIDKEEKGTCLLSSQINQDPESELYIFLSFSVPDATWLHLSEELSKVGGIIVLRGLPNNSFKELASKIYALRKQGLKATIQIDPRLFKKFEVMTVPSFVLLNRNSYDKLSGNVTLSFALDKIPNSVSKSLKAKL